LRIFSAGQAAILDAVGTLGRHAQALFAGGFVFRPVALKENNLTVAFKGQDMGGNAVQEPAVVADHNGTAAEINPKNGDGYYSRGLAWFHKGQNDKAITDYTKAIELNPRFVRAYYNRSYAYETQGQLLKAISDIKRFIQLAPNDRNGPIRLDELNDKLKKSEPSKNYSSSFGQHPWNRGSGHTNRLI
jgi:tetratricopeptide (TPR) repeat protein